MATPKRVQIRCQIDQISAKKGVSTVHVEKPHGWWTNKVAKMTKMAPNGYKMDTTWTVGDKSAPNEVR